MLQSFDAPSTHADGRSSKITVDRLALGLSALTVEALVGPPCEVHSLGQAGSIWRYRERAVTFDGAGRVVRLTGSFLYVDGVLVLSAGHPGNLNAVRPAWPALAQRTYRTPAGTVQWQQRGANVERVTLTAPKP